MDFTSFFHIHLNHIHYQKSAKNPTESENPYFDVFRLRGGPGHRIVLGLRVPLQRRRRRRRGVGPAPGAVAAGLPGAATGGCRGG